jgi:NAD(P)H-hydrate epimerase
VAIDAIFGTGFRGTPEDDFADAIDDLNSSDVPVVAVDIPSGVSGNNGAVEADAVWADVTVTFGAAKPGVVLFPGAEHAGLIEVAGIGFPADLVTSDLQLIEEDDVAEWLPVREPDTHKKATGVVCVVGGSRAMTGAVCLAARAAYRAGAGLVTIAVPQGILPVVQPQVPEATFLPLPDTASGSLSGKAAFDELWKHFGDFDAFAIGPGAGREDEAAEFLRASATAVPGALVLDADGLNAFEGRPGELADRGAADAVLTPHIGEFARLSGEKAAEIEADRIGSTRRLASETKAVVLLKGTRTLIGDPGGEVRINATGSSALATAGSGDVLTGTIAALLGRGLEPLDAASAAAFVHGIAGLRAAKDFGEGTTALDVADQIASAIKDIGGW